MNDMQEICLCDDGKHDSGWGDEYASTAGYWHGKPMPWENDGITLCARCSGNGADKLWGTDDFKAIDVVQAVADYYLLDAIVAKVPNMPPPVESAFGKTDSKPTMWFHKAHKWRKCCDTTEDQQHARTCDPVKRPINLFTFDPVMWDLDTSRRVLLAIGKSKSIPTTMATVRARAHVRHGVVVERLTDAFRRYLHYAIAGELSHMDAMREHFHCSYHGMRTAWFKVVMTIGGAKAAKYAKTLFEDGDWNSSYGGAKWAQIADVLYQYESGKFPAWLFVDRVFTLQHNTGSALNKCVWDTNDQTSWTIEHMSMQNGVLDAHANSDWSTLGFCASPDVKQLFEAMWTLNGNVWASRGLDVPELPVFAVPTKCKGNYCYNYTLEDYCSECKAKNTVPCCALCQPELHCVACETWLDSKSLQNKSEYAGKCEKCAKTNNCDTCKKAILPPKVLCDKCNNAAMAAKAASKIKPTTTQKMDSNGQIVGYTLGNGSKPKPVKPKPKKVMKPKPVPTGGAAAALKATMAAAAEKPFVGKVEDDG